MSVVDTIRSFATVTRQPEPADFVAGEILDVLANDRRRKIVDVLRDEPALSLRSVSQRVASIETGKAVHQITNREYKRVYVSAYQTHIGTLEEFGIVELVDGDSGVVHQGPNFEDAVRVLDSIREITRGEA